METRLFRTVSDNLREIYVSASASDHPSYEATIAVVKEAAEKVRSWNQGPGRFRIMLM